MVEAYNEWIVNGFTTNPTLIKKAGAKNYEEFARTALKAIPDLPISFEMFSDDLDGMERQTRKISGWGENIYIKIPVKNTKGESTTPFIKKIIAGWNEVEYNRCSSIEQVKQVSEFLSHSTPSIVSVFAGRIAIDTIKMFDNDAQTSGFKI